MKHGDLVRVFYSDGAIGDGPDEWDGPFHGVIFETPDMGKNCVWKMWCFERETVHIVRPSVDKIDVVSSPDISLTKMPLTTQ